MVRTAADSLRRTAAKAHAVEVALVGLVALAFAISAVVGGWSLHRISEVSEQNRRLLRNAEAGQQFGLDAVNCLRFVIVEHRFVNEEYHHEQAIALHLKPPVHTELGRRPTTDEIERACAVFDAAQYPPTTTTTR